MKKFSLILESSTEQQKLSKKIESLNKWLYTSYGLGLMKVIDDIFKEQGYEQKISQEEIKRFNDGLEILRKTDMDQNWINKRLKEKLPNGIQQKRLVKDEMGNWHHVNKLNTNYLDIADMISEMIMRSIKIDPEKGTKAFNDVMNDTKATLLSWKPYMKKLLEKYFIKHGNGLDDFKKFTKNSKRNSTIGEYEEDKIIKYLEENDFTIEYQGGNGDFIDMTFGTDIIVYREDVGYKTIQVKKKIIWRNVKYYKVDWIASGDEVKIYDRITEKEVNIEIEEISDIFNRLNET